MSLDNRMRGAHASCRCAEGTSCTPPVDNAFGCDFAEADHDAVNERQEEVDAECCSEGK